MIVKIAPIGERVTEVALEHGQTVSDALNIAGIDLNGRTITLNNSSAELSTVITTDNSIIALVAKMKGGVR